MPFRFFGKRGLRPASETVAVQTVPPPVLGKEAMRTIAAHYGCADTFEKDWAEFERMRQAMYERDKVVPS